MKGTYPWKTKFQEIVNVCQEELKRTTEIGRKMLNATRANSQLHETYEELGQLLMKAMDTGELKWENPMVKELIERIKLLEQEMEEIESEMNKIKFSSGPDDLSKRN
jgi:hypothetical protein